MIEPGNGQEVLMTIWTNAHIPATWCSSFEVAGCGSLCWQAEYAENHIITTQPALLSMMLWVQGVIEPGSGQEVLMTIWINGGIKGTAQLAAAKTVCLHSLLS